MKRIAIAVAATAAIAWAPEGSAQKLTLVHTNDVHSQVEPRGDGLGGAARRKAAIDSIRGTDSNVIVIDAGDAVQGTLYFTLYGGEVEHKLMNALGYDLAILGNHDFDNGMDALATNLKNDSATWISTNYDMRGTPLEGLTVPYAIREVDGKRVGFMGINLNPEGMISKRNYEGMKFLDIYKAANSTAWALKHNEGADVVVAITHIGYDDPELTDDLDLARNSEDIDVIIGGHSHTTVDPANPEGPAWKVRNAAGKEVTVAQTGATGVNLGVVSIDLATNDAESKLISIDSRLDDRISPEVEGIIAPYRWRVDSLMNIGVARTTRQLSTQELANLLADIVRERGKELAGRMPDLAIINNGGIRNPFPKGKVSEGDVIMTLPFDNSIRVIKIKGSDLLPTFDKMGERGINGVSGNVEGTYDEASRRCTSVTIDGKPIDPDKEYLLATIDYLARGGDYLVWLRNGEEVAASREKLSTDVINRLRRTKGKLNPPAEPRIKNI